MEPAFGGDLLNFLKTNGTLKENEARQIQADIVLGLMHLHSKHIVHRDIKLDNILLDKQGRGKLADFGISKMIPPDQLIYEQCGTPAYLAPEIIRNKGYSGYKADVWSLGVLLHALIIGTVPFKAETLEDQYRKILTGKLTMLDDRDQTKEVKDLQIRMQDTNPTTRISASEVLKHKWLQCSKDTDLNPSLENLVVIKSKMRALELVGFNQEFLLNSLKDKTMNHVTSCYYMLDHNIS